MEKYTFTINEYTQDFRDKILEHNGWVLRVPLRKEDGTYSTGKVQFEYLIDYCNFMMLVQRIV